MGEIVCFCCANSPTSFNRMVFVYYLMLVVLYGMVLYFRFNKKKSNIHTVNSIALSLQIATYITVFLSTLISTFWNSKNFVKFFKRLELFDEQLVNFGVCLKVKPIRKYLVFSLTIAVSLILYVCLVDFIIDVIIEENISTGYWLSIFIPIIVNYFGAYFMIVSLYFLLIRYIFLNNFLKNVSVYKSLTLCYIFENLTIIRNYVDLFIALNKITDLLIPQFSLRICTTFLLAFITVTCNMYLLLIGSFPFVQYWLLLNLIGINIIIVSLVIYGHFQVYRKV